ncbi:MAG: hypothetical protein ACPHAS_07070 [Synechococcus sp.]
MGPVAPVRAGSFNANFAPDTLEAFREHCRRQGKQYTKVLERLAELYLQTNGAVLDAAVAEFGAPPTPTSKASKDRQVQVEVLQNKVLQDLLQRVELLEKQKVKMQYEIDRVQKAYAFFQSGLQEPRQPL